MSYKSVKQECLIRALRNSVKQGCPTRVSPQCVRSGCPTSGFAGKCDKYCFCSSTHVSAFGFVGFILFFEQNEQTWDDLTILSLKLFHFCTKAALQQKKQRPSGWKVHWRDNLVPRPGKEKTTGLVVGKNNDVHRFFTKPQTTITWITCMFLTPTKTQKANECIQMNTASMSHSKGSKCLGRSVKVEDPRVEETWPGDGA